MIKKQAFSCPPFSFSFSPSASAFFRAVSHGMTLSPPTRSLRYSLRKRPSENSEQFKLCFFRFLRFLLKDLVKRRHRAIVKERQAAAEQVSKSSTAAGACASNARGRGAAAAAAGSYDADDRLRRQPPPPPPPARGGSSTRSPHAGMPAAVRG